MSKLFQPSDHFCVLLLDLLQYVHVFLLLEVPELDTIFQVGSHRKGVEGQNDLPRSACHAAFYDAQRDLSLWAASLNCSPMSNFSSSSIVKSFSAALLSIPSFPWESGEFGFLPAFFLLYLSGLIKIGL